jgi:uncharacterized protein YndB with AHSA1/START domain
VGTPSTDQTDQIPPPDTASIHIEAPPEEVWDLVADITRIGEWSPECYRCRWQGSERRPVAGAKFVGFNKVGWKRWFTRNVVEEAERGQVWAFLTRDNQTRWSYRFEAEGDGTRLTETRQLPAQRPFLPALSLKLFFGGLDSHDEHMRANIDQTLHRIKAIAER